MSALEAGGPPLVVVSNRLPVDRATDEHGNEIWRTSPGGLVTAMEPVVRDLGCTWVGWPGNIDELIEPFEIGAMKLHPMQLSAKEYEQFYEGFSNDTIWPLFHDVISPPAYHREWWDTYRAVNLRFAEAVASVAEPGSTVWVHDYQLQLVPAILRDLRPDLVIGFFLHIPFPAYGLFSQLPWRRELLEGLLGADLVGFQRVADAANFRVAVRRILGAPSHGNMVLKHGSKGRPDRRVLAQEFAISIDAQSFAALAHEPSVRARAAEIRQELGNPARIILGVDRLDYTKGIRHRLKAFAELWADGAFEPGDVTLVQVASPSRERVAAYRQLRDEIEMTVSRINGDYGSIAHSPVVYLHRGYPREEMVALYLAADVLAVTSLRDGMNLVAKEYVACRYDEQGVLVLSEFTGAADELRRSLLVNPHDIDGLKRAFLTALQMPAADQAQRMRALRRVVFRNDVASWSSSFLRSVEGAAAARTEDQAEDPVILPSALDSELSRLAASPELLVVCDFDGTLAPIVDRPEDARITPRAEHALSVLQSAPGVSIALISGRSIESLGETKVNLEGRIVAGSHGAELLGVDREGRPSTEIRLTRDEQRRFERLRTLLDERVEEVPGAWVEVKPLGFAVHVRAVADESEGNRLLTSLVEHVKRLQDGGEPYHSRGGKMVLEFAVRRADKGAVLREIRQYLPQMPVLFVGDDVTDEDALRALVLGDVGVKVGPGDTVADHRVRDPEVVAAMLARLAELRTGTVIGSD